VQAGRPPNDLLNPWVSIAIKRSLYAVSIDRTNEARQTCRMGHWTLFLALLASSIKPVIGDRPATGWTEWTTDQVVSRVMWKMKMAHSSG
jgi:hypothetical protein